MNPLHPFGGPQPGDDAYPDIDRAEVEECRRLLSQTDQSSATIETYASADELGAARDLEFWGCNPFEED